VLIELPAGNSVDVLATEPSQEWLFVRDNFSAKLGWLQLRDMETLPLDILPIQEMVIPTPSLPGKDPSITGFTIPRVIGNGGARGTVTYFDLERDVVRARFDVMAATIGFTPFVLDVGTPHGSFTFSISGCGTQRVTLSLTLIDSEGHTSLPAYISFECR
jgi:hypothetical protein